MGYWDPLPRPQYRTIIIVMLLGWITYCGTFEQSKYFIKKFVSSSGSHSAKHIQQNTTVQPQILVTL